MDTVPDAKVAYAKTDELLLGQIGEIYDSLNYPGKRNVEHIKNMLLNLTIGLPLLRWRPEDPKPVVDYVHDLERADRIIQDYLNALDKIDKGSVLQRVRFRK